MIAYDDLKTTSNSNEENNFKPGDSNFYDMSTFIWILIGAIVVVNLLFIFIKYLNKKEWKMTLKDSHLLY